LSVNQGADVITKDFEGCRIESLEEEMSVVISARTNLLKWTYKIDRNNGEAWLTAAQ
jgi:hypothetical protein